MGAELSRENIYDFLHTKWRDLVLYYNELGFKPEGNTDHDTLWAVIEKEPPSDSWPFFTDDEDSDDAETETGAVQTESEKDKNLKHMETQTADIPFKEETEVKFQEKVEKETNSLSSLISQNLKTDIKSVPTETAPLVAQAKLLDDKKDKENIAFLGEKTEMKTETVSPIKQHFDLYDLTQSKKDDDPKIVYEHIIAEKKDTEVDEKIIESDSDDEKSETDSDTTDTPGSLPSFSQQIKKAEKTIKIEPKEVKEIQQTIQKKYNYFAQGAIAVTTENLEKGLGVNEEGKLCFKEVKKDVLLLDDEEINRMVLASKSGLWHNVWSTLDKKPYLVNCIPEKRAWSVLHQAIFHGSLEAVKKLVEVYGADITIRTKADLAHAADPGTDALSLAKQLGKKQIYEYLSKEKLLHNHAIKGQDISFFVLHGHGSVYPFQNYPLFQITLASYKTLLMPSYLHSVDQSKHITHTVHDVFTHSGITWQDARLKIRNTLYGVDRGKSEYLLKASDKSEFFQRMVRLYTEESVYHSLTPALQRQPKSPYKPMASDLSVGPYAVMLSAILLQWDELMPYSKTTYRGVNVDVTERYKIGKSLIFLNFLSSSKLKSRAKEFARNEGTIFVFDNSTVTNYRPRDIKVYSAFPHEEECLYPLGAEFKVINVNKEGREVRLKLLDPSV